MKCRTCGQTSYGRVERTNLAGNYRVMICDNCANRWTLYIRSRPEYRQFQVAYAELVKATNIPTDLVVAASDQVSRLEKEIFDIAEEWVEQNEADYKLRRAEENDDADAS